MAVALCVLGATASSSHAQGPSLFVCSSDPKCFRFVDKATGKTLELALDGLYEIPDGGGSRVRIDNFDDYARFRRMVENAGGRLGHSPNWTPPSLPAGASDPVPPVKAMEPTTAAKQQVLTRWQAINQKLGTLPKFGALSTISLGATAGITGWKIGTGVSVWLGLKTPASTQSGSVDGMRISQHTSRNSLILNSGNASDAGNWVNPNPQIVPTEDRPWSVLEYHRSPEGNVWRTSALSAFGGTKNCGDVASLVPASPPQGLLAFLGANPSQCNGSPYPEYRGWAAPTADVLPPNGSPKPYVAGPDMPVHKQTDSWPGQQYTQAQRDQALDEAIAEPLNRPALEKMLDDANWPAAGTPQDPSLNLKTAPNCSGMTYDPCAQAFRDAGFTGTIERQFASFEGAHVDKPAGAVLTTNPVQGQSAEAEQTVTITTNPLEEDMPRLVPAPMPGETYQTYVGRLTELGLIGQVQELTEATADTTKGPLEVVGTDPATGTRVAQGTEVRVEYNPSTIRTDGPSVGPWEVPAVPAVDLSPLSQSIPCGSFPFGVFCWIENALGGWVGGGSCPAFDLPSGVSEDIHVDMCIADGALAIVRPLVLITVAIGLAWLFAATAMGLGASTRDDD